MITTNVRSLYCVQKMFINIEKLFYVGCQKYYDFREHVNFCKIVFLFI